tara:strand:+ start:24967 stop:25677 length:711 start_codon:yes stop_codon:yes gene_type:complete
MIELNNIYNENCLKTMSRMKDCSVDLIVTSPPYNKGYWSSNRNKNNGFKTKSRCIEYDNFDDKMKPNDYDKWQRKVINECLRILKPTGSLFYNHQPIQKLHQEVNPLFIYEFPLKQTIIWNRKNTPKLDKSYFYPTIEYLYWIQKTKTSRTKFNRKNSLFNKCIWDISPDVKNKFPAPFPEVLVENCILSCTDKGDTIYDPFAGSGTTAVVSKRLERKYIASEVGDVNIINVRLKQ